MPPRGRVRPRSLPWCTDATQPGPSFRHSRGTARRPDRRCRGLGVAGLSPASDRASLRRARDPVFGGAPRHRRHDGGPARLRPCRGNRALLGGRRRPFRAVDPAPRRPDLQLRARRLAVGGRNRGGPRRRRRNPAAGALLRALPALRRAARRRVRVAAAVPRRDPALGAAAHAADRDCPRSRGPRGCRGWRGCRRCRSPPLRRGGAPGRSFL